MRKSELQTARHVVHDVRRLSRASLPVDTVELAQYLIGKTIVRNIGRSPGSYVRGLATDGCHGVG